MNEHPERKCAGPHGWCGKIATVVCTADDRLQWYACDDKRHHHGARVQTIAQWWAVFDQLIGVSK